MFSTRLKIVVILWGVATFSEEMQTDGAGLFIHLIGVDWASLKSHVAEAQERIGQLAASLTFT